MKEVFLYRNSDNSACAVWIDGEQMWTLTDQTGTTQVTALTDNGKVIDVTTSHKLNASTIRDLADIASLKKWKLELCA